MQAYPQQPPFFGGPFFPGMQPGMPPMHMPPGGPGVPPGMLYGAPPPHMPPAQRPPPRVVPSPPPVLRPQDKRAVTAQTARDAIQRLVITQLKAEGFDSSSGAALDLVCEQTEACMCDISYTCTVDIHHTARAVIQLISETAQQRANLASRARPSPHDIFAAVTEDIVGIDVSGLRQTSRKRKRGMPSCTSFVHTTDIFFAGKSRAPTLVTPKSRSPSPTGLGSDDEDATPHVPLTLRFNPNHLPKLPPKHTYLRTAVSHPQPKRSPSTSINFCGFTASSSETTSRGVEQRPGPQTGDRCIGSRLAQASYGNNRGQGHQRLRSYSAWRRDKLGGARILRPEEMEGFVIRLHASSVPLYTTHWNFYLNSRSAERVICLSGI